MYHKCNAMPSKCCRYFANSVYMHRKRTKPRVRWRYIGRSTMCISTLHFDLSSSDIFSFDCSQRRIPSPAHSTQYSIPLCLLSLPWWNSLKNSHHTSVSWLLFWAPREGKKASAKSALMQILPEGQGMVWNRAWGEFKNDGRNNDDYNSVGWKDMLFKNVRDQILTKISRSKPKRICSQGMTPVEILLLEDK